MISQKDRIKQGLNTVIFGTETRLGKIFDVSLIFLIILSALLVILESVPEVGKKYSNALYLTEWMLTLIFTLEYFIRIWVTQKKAKYIFSFFGLIDLLAIIPTYVSLFFVGTQSLTIVRAIRVLRIFRILKIPQYYKESLDLVHALKASIPKITIFIGSVIVIACISGSLMYLIEGPKHGFTSIPVGIYWAIVTMTTVGFGDIVPVTTMGKIFSSILMVLGYGIIAVPTGIVTAQMSKNIADHYSQASKKCHVCQAEHHLEKAKYCYHCGAQI